MAFSGSPISDYAADTKRIGATKAWRLQKCSNWIKSWVRLLIIKFLLQIQLNLHLKASHRCSDPCWGGVGNRIFLSSGDDHIKYAAVWSWWSCLYSQVKNHADRAYATDADHVQPCDLDEAILFNCSRRDRQQRTKWCRRRRFVDKTGIIFAAGATS